MPEQTIPDVRKSVTVAVTPEDAFKVFVERPQDWFPPHHILLKTPRTGLAFDREAGGRYYEWDADGNEMTWGTIREYVPGERLILTWRIDARWQPLFDDENCGLIEVYFTPTDEGHTLVELAHTQIWRVGEGAENMFKALDGPSPGDTLERYEKLF